MRHLIPAIALTAAAATAQTVPPMESIRPLIESSCLFCAIRLDLDLAGCRDMQESDPIDPTATRDCFSWAFREYRACTRGCWGDGDLLLELWERYLSGEMTADDVEFVLFGEVPR